MQHVRGLKELGRFMEVIDLKGMGSLFSICSVLLLKRKLHLYTYGIP